MQRSNSEAWHARARTRFALAGLGLLLLVLLGPVASSPAACSLCHSTQSHALATGGHRDVGCYGCHLEQGAWSILGQKTDEVARMYPQALLGRRGPGGPSRLTSRAACLECHADVLGGATEAGGLRIAHATCAAEGSCDACHSVVPHGESVRWRSSAVMDDCTACHERRGVALECDGCHTEDRDMKRGNGPWQVTHGSRWREMHGMGELDGCATCHEEGFCERCHGIALPHPDSFGSTHGEAARKDRTRCLTCHRNASACDACHGLEMPHPEGFLAGHTRFAVSTADARCVRCHVAGDCTQCHANHIHPGGSRLAEAKAQ